MIVYSFKRTMSICSSYIICAVDGVVYEGSAHAWNQVKLDSKWYNIDITNSRRAYAKKWDNIFTDYVNTSDEVFNKTHVPLDIYKDNVHSTEGSDEYGKEATWYFLMTGETSNITHKDVVEYKIKNSIQVDYEDNKFKEDTKQETVETESNSDDVTVNDESKPEDDVNNASNDEVNEDTTDDAESTNTEESDSEDTQSSDSSVDSD